MENTAEKDVVFVVGGHFDQELLLAHLGQQILAAGVILIHKSVDCLDGTRNFRGVKVHFLSVERVNLLVVLNQLLNTIFGLCLFGSRLGCLDLFLVGLFLLGIDFDTPFLSDIGVLHIEVGNVLVQLLACLVLGVELLLTTTRVANGDQVFLLNFVDALWVLALAAKNVFDNKFVEEFL